MKGDRKISLGVLLQKEEYTPMKSNASDTHSLKLKWSDNVTNNRILLGGVPNNSVANVKENILIR